MTSLTRRTLMLGMAASALPAGLAAAPTRYRLDAAASKVGFGFRLGGNLLHGAMPIKAAKIHIDPAKLTSSRVDVTLNAAKARTGVFYATDALVGPGVLDTARFPSIRFVSTRVTLGPDGRLSDGARIRGLLTLRGKTRPIELDAGLYRPHGTPADDLSTLTVRLSGQLSRTAYGATGYADLVADTVMLDITAVVRAET